MAQLKAVLFDFDDTLISWRNFSGNWGELETDRLRGVLELMKSQACLTEDISLETLVNAYMEQTREAWAEARNNLRAPVMPEILRETLHALGAEPDCFDLESCIEAYSWGKIRGTEVFDDVPPFLEELTTRGIKLGIVTNASQPMSMRDKEVEEHGLMDYFPNCRLSAADAGYLKPHPRIFETALECLNLSPKHTVFIGDNPVADIGGAQEVGMKAVLRTKPHGQDLTEGIIHPDAIVDTYDELGAIFDAWYPNGW